MRLQSDSGSSNASTRLSHQTREGFWRRRRTDIAALGLLWLLCLVYLAPLLWPDPAGRLYVVPGDFVNQFFPFRHFAASEWQEGRIPLWNPYVFAGHPFQADIQTAVFYPLSLLTALLGAAFASSRSGLPFVALEAEMALHYPLAATFAYLLGRQLFGERPGARAGAFLAAVAFTFSGFLTSYPAQQLAMLESAIWLPLILFLIERALASKSASLRWLSGAGVAFGVCLLAGHPQTALFIGYFVASWLALRVFTLERYRGLSLIRRLSLLVQCAFAFGLPALGLAAVQLIPTVELIGLSTRADLLYSVSAHGYERRALLGLLLPGWRSEKALYVGLGVIVLGLIAVWRVGLRPEQLHACEERNENRPASLRPLVLFLAVWSVVAIVLSLGDRGYLFRLVYSVFPGFALFRDQERIIFLYSQSLSLLAGIGMTVLLASHQADTIRRFLVRLIPLWLLFVVAFVGALLLGASVAPSIFDPIGSLGLALFVFTAISLLLGLALLLGIRLSPGKWSTIIVALVVFDLFLTNYGNNLGLGNPDPTPRYREISQLLESRLGKPVGAGEAPGEFRVRGETDMIFPPNYAGNWGLPTINGDTPFMLDRVSRLLYAPDGEWRRWQLLNVVYFLTERAPGDGMEEISRQGNISVQRMIYSLPRIWAVRDFKVAASADEALKMVLAAEYHPGDTVILEKEPGFGPIEKGRRPDTRIAYYGAQRIVVEAESDGNAILVLSETYYSGWRASLDGKPVDLLRANYTSRAVELPPGKHTIELIYQPMGFFVGAGISALTLVLWGVALVMLGRRKRRGSFSPI